MADAGIGVAAAGVANPDSAGVAVEDSEEAREAEYARIMESGDGNDGAVNGAGRTAEEPVPEPAAEPVAKGAEPEATADAKLPEGIPGEVKEKIQERINTMNRKMHEAEERAEAESAKALAAGERAREAEERLEQQGVDRAAQGAGVPRVLLAESAAAIDAREAQLETFVEKTEDWIAEHEPDDTLEEDGKSFTFAEVKGFLRNARRELTKSVPRARELVKQRAEHRTEAARLYPEALKAGTPEARELAALADEMPEIRAKPDWQLRLCRMIAGRKLESGKAAAPKTVARNAATTLPPPAVRPSGAAAPRVPPTSGAAVFDQKRVVESGLDPDVIDQEYAKVLSV